MPRRAFEDTPKGRKLEFEFHLKRIFQSGTKEAQTIKYLALRDWAFSKGLELLSLEKKLVVTIKHPDLKSGRQWKIDSIADQTAYDVKKGRNFLQDIEGEES
jgi:hypothetical protein